MLGRLSPGLPLLVGALRPRVRSGVEAGPMGADRAATSGPRAGTWAASAHEAAAKRARVSTEASSSNGLPVRVHEWGEGALLPARLVRRYKRFLADCVLLENDWETPRSPEALHVGRGETPEGGAGLVTVHCPNPGAMLGMLQTDGAEPQLCRVSLSKAKGRKLPLTLEQLQVPLMDGRSGVQWMGCNTQLANAVVAACLRRGVLSDRLGSFDSFRREVRYGRDGRSRVDFVLNRGSAGKVDLYLEVKNVTYLDGGLALFPDCVSARATKHLDDLMHVSSSGENDAAVLFFVNAGDLDGARNVSGFAPAVACDPAYARRYWEAVAAGVIMIAPKFAIDPDTGDICFVGYAEPCAS